MDYKFVIMRSFVNSRYVSIKNKSLWFKQCLDNPFSFADIFAYNDPPERNAGINKTLHGWLAPSTDHWPKVKALQNFRHQFAWPPLVKPSRHWQRYGHFGVQTQDAIPWPPEKQRPNPLFRCANRGQVYPQLKLIWQNKSKLPSLAASIVLECCNFIL